MNVSRRRDRFSPHSIPRTRFSAFAGLGRRSFIGVAGAAGTAGFVGAGDSSPAETVGERCDPDTGQVTSVVSIQRDVKASPLSQMSGYVESPELPICDTKYRPPEDVSDEAGR